MSKMCDCRNDCEKKKTYLILSLLFHIVFSEVPFEMTNKSLQVEEFKDHTMTNVPFKVDLPLSSHINNDMISPVILFCNNCFLSCLVNSSIGKKRKESSQDFGRSNDWMSEISHHLRFLVEYVGLKE